MANTDPYWQLKELFAAALEKPAEEREAFLQSAAADHPATIEKLRELLAAHDRDATLQLGSAPINASADLPGSERIGDTIGAYKLVELIGEGGFGSVYLALQDQPVRRRVALKIIKIGMDTRQVIARFEQERQALAILDHPNIAKVFDAGATETGRPYFVMELCKGEAIEEYCDKHSLSIEQRLELFAQVCVAVQHAHTKGIIHRDIKPSNVLVTTQDGKPSAKIIDFGIAKATASKLTEKTLFTEHKQLIGTPEYMSPEQAEGSLDIDTRTDVYSLGVMLYELLTGATPFDSKQLRSAAYAEIARIIREVDPPKPSTRLSENTDTIATVASQRHTEPRKLGTIVRGELDWIVMKALEKDRSRRYETANGLAMDIRRYLAGEAILAAPPSASYRLRKFVLRNKSVVTATAAVAAALLIGLIAFASQAKIARHQRDRAVVAEAQAKTRAQDLQQVSDFQAKMLNDIDATEAGRKLMESIRARFAAELQDSSVPPEQRAAQIQEFSSQLARVNATDTAVELIDGTILKPAVKAIGLQFKNQPLVDASLRKSLAEVYHTLGKYLDAVNLESDAVATRRHLLGEDNPDTISASNDLGAFLEADGKEADAEKLYRDVLVRSRRVMGEDDPLTLSIIGDLGDALRSQGKFAEAEPLLIERLEKSRRVLGSSNYETLTAINCLGYLYVEQGKSEKAEPLWREAYDTGRQTLGEDNAEVLTWMSNLASLLGDEDKFAEAEPLQRGAIEKCRRIRGEDHPTTIAMTAQLGHLLLDEGKYSEGESVFRGVLDAARRALGNDHPDIASFTANIGDALSHQHRYAEAEPYYRQTLELRRHVLGEDHADTLLAYHNLGCVLLRMDRFADAEHYLRQALSGRRRVLGMENPDTQSTMANLANLFDACQKPADAEAMWRELLDLQLKFNPEKQRRIANLQSHLGAAMTEQNKFAEAEPLLLAGYQALVKTDSVPHDPDDDVQEACGRLMKLYRSWDAADPGKGHDAASKEWAAKLPATQPATQSTTQPIGQPVR